MPRLVIDETGVAMTFDVWHRSGPSCPWAVVGDRYATDADARAEMVAATLPGELCVRPRGQRPRPGDPAEHTVAPRGWSPTRRPRRTLPGGDPMSTWTPPLVRSTRPS